MTRLIDRIVRSSLDDTYPAAFKGVDGSVGEVVAWAFGSPDDERILPLYNNAIESYASSSVVFGIILTRIQLFSQAVLKWQSLQDDHIFGDDTLALLETPWPNGSTSELLTRMIQDADLAGNSFIRKVDVDLLERLRPDRVEILSGIRQARNGTEYRELLGYWYDPVDEDREPALYLPSEVAHWAPINDPLANWRGMSWITPVLRDIDSDRAMTDYKRAYLTNAATPNLVIKYQAKADPVNLDRLKAEIAQKYSGLRNAYKSMVLDNGADVTVVGSNFAELAYEAVQAAGENRIAVASGTPAIVVGLKEGLDAAGWSVYTNAMRRFGDLTMTNLWRSAFDSLASIVPPPGGARLWHDVRKIPALQQGEKERADATQVFAAAIASLVTQGYTRESAVVAVTSGDLTRLVVDTEFVSVQLQAAKAALAPKAPATAPTQQEGDA